MNTKLYNPLVKSIGRTMASELLWGYNDTEGANMFNSIETVEDLEAVLKNNNWSIGELLELEDLFDADEINLIQSLRVHLN